MNEVKKRKKRLCSLIMSILLLVLSVVPVQAKEYETAISTGNMTTIADAFEEFTKNIIFEKEDKITINYDEECLKDGIPMVDACNIYYIDTDSEKYYWEESLNQFNVKIKDNKMVVELIDYPNDQKKRNSRGGRFRLVL